MKQYTILSLFISSSFMLSLLSCSMFNPKYKDLVQENNIHTIEELKDAAVVIDMTTTNKVPLVGSYETISEGSGFVFYENSSRYYAITNNHVIFKMNGFSNPKYTITDHQGNVYDAKVEKSDSKYDLAVISFPKKDNKLNIVHISEKNPEVGNDVSAIDNSFVYTTGKIKNYEPGSELSNSINASSNVRFDIIVASTYIHSGSSGGMLVDSYFNVVGVVYASETLTTGEFISSYSIPCEKLLDFLKNK